VGDIFKSRFSEATDNLDVKIKKLKCSGLGLKRKRKAKNAICHGKRRKVKDIFTDEKKKK